MSCHDVSLGGILTAVSKMCIKGKKGIKINSLKGLTNKYEYFFGEDQARYIVEIPEAGLKKVDVPISEGISTYKVVDRSDPLIETALALGVYVGDIK